jgi:Ca-activated chloride channel homolog
MRAARVLLLAAAQLCCAGLMSATALAGNVPAVWSDLWRTPDQQGQALLDAGQPAQAADRFHDPRRRAYADLEAGRYPEAAQLLAPFTDAESEYNRGNALAEAGQLQAALTAYDAALKQAPTDEDIRHNRDLVERALRQKHQSPQSSSPNGRQGGQGAASQGQQPQQSNAGQRSGSGSQRSAGASQQSGARGPQSAGAGQTTASGGSQTDANQPGNSGQQESGPEAPGQAQRDASLAAALAREQQKRGASGTTTQAQGSARNGSTESAPRGAGQQGSDRDSLLAGGTQTPRQKPESERQLALDQWLRQIPDNPAGLLQRKFLIEHMMKQQGSGESQESDQ